MGSWGAPVWDVLKEIARGGRMSRRLIMFVQRILPCGLCRESFKEFLKRNPPPEDTASPLEWLLWLSSMHNLVNKKLGKYLFTGEEIRAWATSVLVEEERDEERWIRTVWDLVLLWALLFEEKDVEKASMQMSVLYDLSQFIGDMVPQSERGMQVARAISSISWPKLEEPGVYPTRGDLFLIALQKYRQTEHDHGGALTVVRLVSTRAMSCGGKSCK